MWIAEQDSEKNRFEKFQLATKLSWDILESVSLDVILHLTSRELIVIKVKIFCPPIIFYSKLSCHWVKNIFLWFLKIQIKELECFISTVGEDVIIHAYFVHLELLSIQSHLIKT